jgi:hypothetical protein
MEQPMSYKFSNLEAACGGSINPDTLRRFQAAMREYEQFMVGLDALLTPKTQAREQERLK